MENITNSEQVIFKYIIEHPEYLKFVGPKLFNNKTLSTLIVIEKRFYDKYSVVATKEQMYELIKDKADELTNDIVSTLYDIDVENYDQEWLKTNTEKWLKWKSFYNDYIESSELLKLTSITIDNVDSVIQEVQDKVQKVNGMDFSHSGGLDLYDPDAHYQGSEEMLLSGHKFVDAVAGGYGKKTLVAYIGSANIGKCVCKDSMITVRNSKTHEVMTVPIEKFYNMLQYDR